MPGVYANKYGLLVALIIDPLRFCLLLSFHQRFEYIYSSPLDINRFKFCDIVTVKGEVNMFTIIFMYTCSASGALQPYVTVAPPAMWASPENGPRTEQFLPPRRAERDREPRRDKREHARAESSGAAPPRSFLNAKENGC